MNRHTNDKGRKSSKAIFSIVWMLFLLLFAKPLPGFAQSAYPVHVSVQVLPPYGVYLTDYYSGSRDRLIVTLLNRDQQQRPLQVKLRVQVKNSSMFRLSSREELYYPMITLESGIPFRLTSGDLAAYLSHDKIRVEGYLKEGKLPTGMTEFSIQAVDYITGRALSDFGTGRAWLELKQPPSLNMPLKDEQIAYKNPQQIRFQWMPRHQGLANTMYEFVLKELPDNGAPPQAAFAYGFEIYRVQTRFTTLNYSVMEPSLIPGKRYAWQVRAIAKDGMDEIGMFENNGYSEIGWFELNDNCPSVTNVTAKGGYRKMTLEWKSMPEQRAFVVEHRPKSEHNLYEWTSTRTFDNSLLIHQLKPGWKYEYRVGAFCLTDKPVFSPVGEIVLSEDNEERLANCGVPPIIDRSNQQPKEDLKVGDVVIVGGDFPMTVTQLSSQGNGWYSGKGWTTLTWIFEIKVAVKFNRLRVNTDNRQIDGEVESETDPKAGQIGNTNELDYGGSKTNSAKVVFEPQKVDFTVPPVPTGSYDPDSGELILFDTSGQPHVIATQKNEGESIFPMVIEDAEGNKYQIDAPSEQGTAPSGGAGNSGGGKQEPIINKVESVPTDFDPNKLSAQAGFTVQFSKGKGKYGFDAAKEPWYQRALLIRHLYEPLSSDYIVPWKLIPVGESDVVEAELSGKSIDKQKIKFVLKDGTSLPAREEDGKWQLTLPSVKASETYEVLAVYEAKKGRYETVGKLNVVSYPKQKQVVTLIPVDGTVSDVAWTEEELNRIYNPYGVDITVKTDDSLKGNTGWDLDGDGVLNLNGSGFFSKETDEMKALRKLYQQTASSYNRNAYYIFLVNQAKAGDEPDAGLAVQGDMPRGKQFGYIFMQSATNTPQLIAHELGHGIFTLTHSFDVNYSGDKFKAATGNLMDYNKGTELAVWQWNVMSNPAPLTWFDSEDDSKSVSHDILITGQSAGIAPDGKIIIGFKASKEGYNVVPGIKSGSYFMQSLNLYDSNHKEVKSYKWNDTEKTYYAGQESIEKSDDIVLTYNTATVKVQATIYNVIGDHCFYHYAKVLHTSGSLDVEKPSADQWEEGLLLKASADCTTSFNKEQILLKDRKGCTPAESEAEVAKLRTAIKDQKEASQLVSVINNVYLSSLRCLNYDEISGLIQKIASQESLKEESELAIIRLMNGIKGEDYSLFYTLLEENNNKLINYLVNQINDASLCFWYNNNYTNFIGALVTMFNQTPNSIADRWPKEEDDYIKRVVNLKPENYQKSVDFSQIVLTDRKNSSKYNEGTGTVALYDVYTTATYDIGPTGQTSIKKEVKEELLSELSPLTPVVLVLDETPLPLVETALEGATQLSENTYVVPAIFLKYKDVKVRNHKIEVGTIITLDVVTIAASGGTVLAAHVTKVRRIWALSEVAGAVASIGVHTVTVTDPNLKAAVDIYNSAVGVIGLGHVGKGVVGFANDLSPITKSTLAKGESLRSQLTLEYAKWKAAISKSNNLIATERTVIEKQLWNWRLCLHLLPDEAYLYNPNMSDNIRQIVTNSGVGMGRFVNINYWASRGMANAEDVKWLQDFVTKHFPTPKDGDRVRKVISISDFENFHKGKPNPILPKASFITKAEDYVIPKSSKELIEDLRLDYSNTGFSKDKGFVVIEYKNKSHRVDYTFNTSAVNEKLPYTNTGMTGAKQNIIPEYYSPDKVEFAVDDILTVFNKDGNIIKKYKYKKVKGDWEWVEY